MSVRISPSPSESRGVLAPGPHLRRAFTLIEMLVGMAITLVMMAAVVNLFANIGAGVKIRRATMEMSGELRMMRATLFNDLAGATCLALPWREPADDEGYIEIVEGDLEDTNPTNLTLNLGISQIPGSQNPNTGTITDASGLGDFDDILALTVRNELAPFKGRSVSTGGQPESIESPLAEVIWYAVENTGSTIGEPGMRTVYRRVLIIAPWADLSGIAPPMAVTAAEYERFYDLCDVSVRIEAQRDSTNTFIWKWVPNTLGDLSKRENRIGHYYALDTTGPVAIVTGFPHLFPHDWGAPPSEKQAGPNTSLEPFEEDRLGEDVMLSNVLAFDVRVFDAGAPLFEYPVNSGTIVEPFGVNSHMPGGGTFFNTIVNGGTLVGFGAYVDLGWDDNYDYPVNTTNPTTFQETHQVGWHPRAPGVGRGGPGLPAVYDTWSFHYETDGLDQDPTNPTPALANLVDQGTNGLDDDGVNGVDDLLERETSPPYPVPLRGMQVIVRIYEPETRQIREATVTRNFVQP